MAARAIQFLGYRTLLRRASISPKMYAQPAAGRRYWLPAYAKWEQAAARNHHKVARFLCYFSPATLALPRNSLHLVSCWHCFPAVELCLRAFPYIPRDLASGRRVLRAVDAQSTQTPAIHGG